VPILKKLLEISISVYTYAISTYHLNLILFGSLTIAEVYFLLGKEKLSQLYWTECRDLFCNLFLIQTNFIHAERASITFLQKLEEILKKMIRLLLSFGPPLINDNLFLLDSLTKLQLEIKKSYSKISSKVEDRPPEEPSIPNLPNGKQSQRGKNSISGKDSQSKAWNIFSKVLHFFKKTFIFLSFLFVFFFLFLSQNY